ncbi:Na+/H+ antiporter NhaA [Draconibacterium halophilum]|uniref:Na(+)/H(+) antiporter NhaA n=1 Tax=Draconibacterium halophilum TaxID=2706887 RepID=A0A6C0RGD7_9BACT|nr:Na+/H+ antiporter NhaA [Draconibacterium halophilum]QIA08583.1 Na+/H+ antiporter NhaA [Draconibacterium halophilum]
MNFIKEPINRFIKLETSSSIILFAASIAALILANSGLSETFLGFWKNYVTISVPGFELSKPILKWINDGLMAIFFFLIGLEIKREILIGELSDIKKASLPIIAAFGGMVFPALLFATLNKGNAGMEGWGIPMATDIAFSLGILTLLGKRVPVGLKVFLMAFAIIDDLGAVLVIAFFYSSKLIWANIAIGLAIVLFLLILTRFKLYSKYFFFIAGLVVWVLFLKSGIHSTIAGVLMALTIPLRRHIKTSTFYDKAKEILNDFRKECEKPEEDKTILNHNQLDAIDEMEELTEKTASPIQFLEHRLHGWVAFIILPLFAFANAGVVFSFSGDTNTALASNIGLSLIIGKFVGIFLVSFLAIKFKISELPKNVNFTSLAGVSFLGGLGFTMSLFINNLAFTDEILINSAKMGILLGSFVAGLLGYILLRVSSNKKNPSAS